MFRSHEVDDSPGVVLKKKDLWKSGLQLLPGLVPGKNVLILDCGRNF